MKLAALLLLLAACRTLLCSREEEYLPRRKLADSATLIFVLSAVIMSEHISTMIQRYWKVQRLKWCLVNKAT